MWITQLFSFMRIWIRHLYSDLYSVPCTNYSIDPDFWSQLTDCLVDDLQFRRQPVSSAIPIRSTLVSVRHQTISSKSDLHTVQISHRRIWMRIRDPNSDKRLLAKSSIRILEMYKHWLEHSSPLVPLRPRPLWSGHFAADAFANSDICDTGGFIQTDSHQCFWFSERFTKQDFDALQIPIDDDLQKIISALELLAQIAIVYTVARLFPGHRVPIRIHIFSDNTGAESGSNKLFTMQHPQCFFCWETLPTFSNFLYGIGCPAHCWQEQPRSWRPQQMEWCWCSALQLSNVRSSANSSLWSVDSKCPNESLTSGCTSFMEVASFHNLSFLLCWNFNHFFMGIFLAFEIWGSSLWGLVATSNINWRLATWQHRSRRISSKRRNN